MKVEPEARATETVVSPGEAFEPALALYRARGFFACPPFADYAEDPNSVFMTRTV